MGNNNSGNLATKSPPMRIHKLHSPNLEVTGDDLIARRKEGYSDGLIFGSRPLERDEDLEITVRAIMGEWNGSLRFGVTSNSPNAIKSHTEGIPRYMCPDLIKRGGTYVETLSGITLAVNDRVIFSINRKGDFLVKLNGVSQKIQNRNINATVWPVIDVYGNCKEVMFRSLKDNYIVNSLIPEPKYYTSLHLKAFPLNSNASSIELNSNKTVAKCHVATNGFVWNKKPLGFNVIFVIFIKEISSSPTTLLSDMSLCIINKNPSTINPVPRSLKDFNKDSNNVYIEKIYSRMEVGDELAICLSDKGKVLVAINGLEFEQVKTVTTKTTDFWLIIDMSCGISCLESVGVFELSGIALPQIPTTGDIKPTFSLARINGASGSNSTDFAVMEIGDHNHSSLGNQRNLGQNNFSKSLSFSNTHKSCQADLEFDSANAVSLPAQSASNRQPFPECVICMEQPCAIAFKPCGHFVCCLPCYDNMRNEYACTTCPTCRGRIEDFMRIYT